MKESAAIQIILTIFFGALWIAAINVPRSSFLAGPAVLYVVVGPLITLLSAKDLVVFIFDSLKEGDRS